MACTTNTNSISLAIAGGNLSATLNLDPGTAKSPNGLQVSAAGVYLPTDGWVPLSGLVSLAWVSTDGHTYVASTSIDTTPFIQPGDKIKLTQAATTLYFIVTAVSATQLTLYGGTNYTLANAAITAPFFSKATSPVGFNLDPTIWTELLKDTSDRAQAGAVANTWYNPGALALAVPIGVWRTVVQAEIEVNRSDAPDSDVEVTLSTANNSESDVDWTARARSSVGGTTSNVVCATTVFREKVLVNVVKTSYFLNIRTTTGGTNTLTLRGATSPSIVRAICAYLR